MKKDITVVREKERIKKFEMNVIVSFLNILLISFGELIYLLGFLIAIGFILGVLERYSNRFLVQAWGPRGIMLTAWIGTPIHELGHLLMCFIWGHRVSKVKLLQLNSPDGVLGYVAHQYNPNSFYQQVGNFFIGVGPIFSGIGSLILGMYLLLPQSYHTFIMEIEQHVSFEKLDATVLKSIGEAGIVITKSLFTFHNFINPLFWIFLIFAISISSHIALSKADIENSARGLIMIYFLLILFNISSGFLRIDSYKMIEKIGEYNSYVLAFSSIALLFSSVTFLISFLLFKLKTL